MMHEQKTIHNRFDVIVVVYVKTSHKSNVSIFDSMNIRAIDDAKNMMSRY